MGGRADGVCVCVPRVHTEKVFWVPNRFFKHELQPVIMGIRNGTRCLACPAAPQPTLQLQVGARGGAAWGRHGGGDGTGVGMAWGCYGDAMGTQRERNGDIKGTL